MSYLRNKPFFLVEFSFVPSRNTDTRKKGWKQDGGLVTMNKVNIVDRVSVKAEQKSSIIIDLLESTVIKNSTKTSDDEVLKRYMSEYSDQIIQALRLWAIKNRSSTKGDA